MERVEKTKFILEQMRLLLEVARVKDAESPNAGKSDKGALSGSGGETEWVKLRVQSRKVNEQFLKEPGNEVRPSGKLYETCTLKSLRHRGSNCSSTI
jgi:26S proteasome regulatory subunit N5